MREQKGTMDKPEPSATKKARLNVPNPDSQMSVRSIRTLPFYFVQKAVLEMLAGDGLAILTYNALAYYATDSRCKNVGLRAIAQLVGRTEGSIRTGISRLTAKKLLICRKRSKMVGGKRVHLPNEYTLVDPAKPNRQAI